MLPSLLPPGMRALLPLLFIALVLSAPTVLAGPTAFRVVWQEAETTFYLFDANRVCVDYDPPATINIDPNCSGGPWG